jgi:hypothetical protein
MRDTRAAGGTADARIPLCRRVYERIVRFLYAQKKVFDIMGLKLPAGRLWPAAAVTSAPGEARRPVFPLRAAAAATRCATEP